MGPCGFLPESLASNERCLVQFEPTAVESETGRAIERRLSRSSGR